MKTGLIVAMEEEIPSLLCSPDFKEGGIYEVNDGLTLAVTGFGADNAIRVTEQLYKSRKLDEVICLGFCGSVSDIGIGELVIAGSTRYKRDIILLPMPERISNNCRVCNFETFDQAVTSRDNVCREISVVDMESYFIAEISRKYKIPLIIAKAVTDIVPSESIDNPRERFLQEFYKNLPVAKQSLDNFFEGLVK